MKKDQIPIDDHSKSKIIMEGYSLEHLQGEEWELKVNEISKIKYTNIYRKVGNWVIMKKLNVENYSLTLSLLWSLHNHV
jgi:ribosome biogenesis SPOUT family RNA methylase Rps3